MEGGSTIVEALEEDAVKDKAIETLYNLLLLGTRKKVVFSNACS